MNMNRTVYIMETATVKGIGVKERECVQAEVVWACVEKDEDYGEGQLWKRSCQEEERTTHEKVKGRER